MKCDVRDWDEQVAVFEAASSASPCKSVDIVIANAGIIRKDDFNTLQGKYTPRLAQEWRSPHCACDADLNGLIDPSHPPVKPDFSIINTNLVGTAYTAQLAIHYFRRQDESPSRDRCLVIKGSVAAYVDQPGSPQYNISKWGARGLFRNLRRTAWRQGIRVNFVAPW